MNFSGKEFKLQPRTAVSVFIILLFLLLSSAYLEFQNRKKATLELMALMSENLSKTIRQAAINSILSYDALEDELANRTLDALHRIANQRQLLEKSDDSAERLAQEYHLVGLKVIDISGKPVWATGPAALDFPDSGELAEWLTSGDPQTVFGVEMDVLAAGLRLPTGGALIGYTDATELSAYRRTNGLGSLINNISRNSAVAYIAIQDSLGILAATANVATLPAIASDQFLQAVLDSADFQWRIGNFQERRVFEGILPFDILDASYGLIRIGLDYKPIQAIQTAAIRQVALRLGILLFIGFLLAAFSITTQNVHLLRAEKAHITDEVFRLQNDLRRREKLSAMGELAAGVAHEIRNPLNAISMTVQRLAREFPAAEGADEQAELIKIVRREIDRISAIIRQFLEFARPAPLVKKPVLVGELISKVVALYTARAASQQVKIEWENRLSVKALLDADKITQCLVNLLENALDAVAIGGNITIHLETSRRKYFSITIEDDGAGIPPENQSRIFNLYFTTKANGTGLGLAQVLQTVSEHDGTVAVFSEPGRGTRFVLTIPMGKE